MINGRSVLAVIPARGGSKGIPGKNLVEVGRRPLIQWTIDAANASLCIDRVILTSDDPVIIRVAQELGCDVPFTRSADLSTDEASSIDVVLDALKRVSGYDIVVLLQPTSPLRNACDIDAALHQMIRAKAPSIVSIRPAVEHPYLMYHQDAVGVISNYCTPPVGVGLRRQDLPTAWCLNGAIYAAEVSWFVEQRSFISPQTIGYPMPTNRSIDIDVPTDINLIEEILSVERI